MYIDYINEYIISSKLQMNVVHQFAIVIYASSKHTIAQYQNDKLNVTWIRVW
jgi:hypothetical protein